MVNTSKETDMARPFKSSSKAVPALLRFAALTYAEPARP